MSYGSTILRNFEIGIAEEKHHSAKSRIRFYKKHIIVCFCHLLRLYHSQLQERGEEGRLVLVALRFCRLFVDTTTSVVIVEVAHSFFSSKLSCLPSSKCQGRRKWRYVVFVVVNFWRRCWDLLRFGPNRGFGSVRRRGNVVSKIILISVDQLFVEIILFLFFTSVASEGLVGNRILLKSSNPGRLKLLEFEHLVKSGPLFLEIVRSVKSGRELEVAFVFSNFSRGWRRRRYFRGHFSREKYFVAFRGQGPAAMTSVAGPLRSKAKVPIGVGGWLKVDVGFGLTPWVWRFGDRILVEGAEVAHFVGSRSTLKKWKQKHIENRTLKSIEDFD